MPHRYENITLTITDPVTGDTRVIEPRALDVYIRPTPQQFVMGHRGNRIPIQSPEEDSTMTFRASGLTARDVRARVYLSLDGESVTTDPSHGGGMVGVIEEIVEDGPGSRSLALHGPSGAYEPEPTQTARVSMRPVTAGYLRRNPPPAVALPQNSPVRGAGGRILGYTSRGSSHVPGETLDRARASLGLPPVERPAKPPTVPPPPRTRFARILDAEGE